MSGSAWVAVRGEAPAPRSPEEMRGKGGTGVHQGKGKMQLDHGGDRGDMHPD